MPRRRDRDHTSGPASASQRQLRVGEELRHVLAQLLRPGELRDPALRPGDQIFLLLDGQPLNGGVATGSQFTLTPLDRGTHTLQAVVRDSGGGLMCQTPGVTYNVHQPSILSPANPLHH